MLPTSPGEEFTIGSPKQLEGSPVQQTGAPAQAPGQDRLLDRRPGAPGDSPRARRDPPDRALPPDSPSSPRPTSTHFRSSSPPTAGSTPPSARRPLTTGRLMHPNNPNLQNIPIRTELGREIRACFVAEPGNLLVSADYSQVELRLLAHIAGEDVLKEIFRRGEDVHTATARRVFGVTPDRSDRHALEGEDGQLRHRLRAVRLRDGRSARHPAVRGRRIHPALSRRLPGRRALHRGDDRPGNRARDVSTLFGPPSSRSPRSAPAAGTCFRGALRGQHG